MTSGKAGKWLGNRSKQSFETVFPVSQLVLECCFLTG
jgi:hypothetical protein